MTRLTLVMCLGLSIAAVSGCSPSSVSPATPTGKVSGTIAMDGKPIPTGEIHFGMAGVPPKVLEIKDGKFTGDAPVGKNQVEVFVYVEGPSTEKYGGTRGKKNTTPQKYWGANTTLSATVTAAGPNDLKFDITSK